MELINNWVAAINEAGLRINVYNTINSVAFYLAILLGILHGMKLRVGIIAVIVSVLIERYLAGTLASAIIFVENGFVDTGKQNGVVVFPYIPLIGLLFAVIFKKKYTQMWDILMVPPMIMFAGARVACTVAGCCRGYPCDWGVYNPKTNEIVFPIQLLEAIVTILILIYVLLRERKNKFAPDGRNVPIILISYGVLRFFLEFFHDNEKVALVFASTQFHCLLMIAVGILTLYIINRNERKVMGQLEC